ncbi:MAG: hypothetical protein ACT4NX_10200 [Deltaproteobacteria bacterium]
MEARIHIGEAFSVSFQRTLRIPDDGRVYPLPPGLGEFPIMSAADFAGRVPDEWISEGAHFISMYQREALWLAFEGRRWKPNAVIIAIGGVNILTGKPRDDKGLISKPQNYLVAPDQPWIDGIKSENGGVRQFVAMPLGMGYTVEGQITGSETLGGIQIKVYEPKPGRFPDEPPRGEISHERLFMRAPAGGSAMGLGAGGRIKQKIYPDKYGARSWDRANFSTAAIYIINSARYLEITGMSLPPTPISAKTYTNYGFPWFDLYDETLADIPASEALSGVKSIKNKDAEGGIDSGDENKSVDIAPWQIKKLDV